MVRACGAAFSASFCILVIELVAARIMAPYVGVSLYTWTSIIGVILAGISLGAFAGGILADRFPRRSILGWLFLLAGLSALAIAPLADVIGSSTVLQHFAGTLIARVLLVALSVFFLPAFLLGMISPVAVKLALKNLEKSGAVIGRIYAFSTLGSILGTFLTGFVLIAFLGTRTVLLLVALALVFSAIVFSDAWKRLPFLVAILLFGGALAFAGPSHLAQMYNERFNPLIAGGYYFDESEYYTIRLQQTRRPNGNQVEVLVLDRLVHSFSDVKDPSYLHYEYLQFFDDLIRWKLRENPAPRLLFLGGGGYTLPRYVALSYPNAVIDVVEIDPAVSRVAEDFLGVPAGGRINTINTDARWFIMTTPRKYDAIFCDAFNDLSIPFHLTTREFDARLAGVLSPGGFIAANVIDNYERGRFLPSYVHTMRSVLGHQNVALLSEQRLLGVDTQAPFVVVGSPDASAFRRYLQRADRPANMAVILPGALTRDLAVKRPILLTDDYAPVDRLVAELFEDRYHYRDADEPR